MIGYYSFAVDVIDGNITLINEAGNHLDIDVCDDIIDLLTKYKDGKIKKYGDLISLNKKYVSKIKRGIIFKTHGNKCLCCGKSGDIGIDHIIPIAHGGDNNIDNLQILCRYCNSKKGKHNIIDYRKNIDKK